MNVYYDPEKFGLTIIGEVEFSSGSYEFDMTLVWKAADGSVYVADDSGCSCPTPFEGMGIADLTKIERLQDLIAYFDKRKAGACRFEDSNYAASIDGDIGAVIQKYREATR